MSSKTGARSQPLLHDGLVGDDGIEELVSFEGSAEVGFVVSAFSGAGGRKAAFKRVLQVRRRIRFLRVRFPWFCPFSRSVIVNRDRPHIVPGAFPRLVIANAVRLLPRRLCSCPQTEAGTKHSRSDGK